MYYIPRGRKKEGVYFVDKQKMYDSLLLYYVLYFQYTIFTMRKVRYTKTFNRAIVPTYQSQTVPLITPGSFVLSLEITCYK